MKSKACVTCAKSSAVHVTQLGITEFNAHLNYYLVMHVLRWQRWTKLSPHFEDLCANFLDKWFVASVLAMNETFSTQWFKKRPHEHISSILFTEPRLLLQLTRWSRHNYRVYFEERSTVLYEPARSKTTFFNIRVNCKPTNRAFFTVAAVFDLYVIDCDQCWAWTTCNPSSTQTPRDTIQNSCDLRGCVPQLFYARARARDCRSHNHMKFWKRE